MWRVTSSAFGIEPALGDWRATRRVTNSHALRRRAHALQVARDMIQRNRFDMIRNLFDCAFEITDERGVVVLNVPFTEAVPSDEE